MRVALPDWTALALFAATVLVVTLYGLTVSAHFPAEHRRPSLTTPVGTVILWTSMTIAMAVALWAVRYALAVLPGYAAVIAAGAAILVAPLLMKVLPDSFLDGRAGLVTFALLAVVCAVIAAP